MLGSILFYLVLKTLILSLYSLFRIKDDKAGPLICISPNNEGLAALREGS